MSRLTLTPLALAGLHLVQRQRMSDSRGDLSRIFCAHELAAAGWTQPIAQINHTRTARRGTVRGLHFQRAPHAEAKLVSCIRGEVWDVAVDLRQGSATFFAMACPAVERRQRLRPVDTAGLCPWLPGPDG